MTNKQHDADQVEDPHEDAQGAQELHIHGSDGDGSRGHKERNAQM